MRMSEYGSAIADVHCICRNLDDCDSTHYYGRHRFRHPKSWVEYCASKLAQYVGLISPLRLRIGRNIVSRASVTCRFRACQALISSRIGIQKSAVSSTSYLLGSYQKVSCIDHRMTPRNFVSSRHRRNLCVKTLLFETMIRQRDPTSFLPSA